MRSRYAALVLGELEYLWATLHSQHEDRASDPSEYRQALLQAIRAHKYKKLQVLDTAGPDVDGIAQVLFYAQVSWGKVDRSFVELSTFVQEDSQWRYITGTAKPASELAHKPSDLTIDRWDCDDQHH